MSAQAQTKYDTRIAKGGQRLKVAVDELTLGLHDLSADLKTRSAELAEVVRQDLAFSGYFTIVRFDSLYMKFMGVDTLGYEGWAHLGAEYLGAGELSPNGNGFLIRFRLNGTPSGEIVFNKAFNGLWTQSRQVAHQIANEIIYYLWGGRTQVFDTKLVFTREGKNGKDLYISDYDGFNARAITNHGGINMSPSWYPSGDRIVFTSFRDGKADLWQLTVRDNKMSKVSGRPGLNTAPCASPDGRSIVAALSKDGNSELYQLTDRGDIVRRLTNSAAIESEPSVSPDGHRVAFTSDRLGLPQVFVMNADGSDVRRVTHVGSYNASPAWSPRGDKIALVSRNERGSFDLCTVNPDGTLFTILSGTGSNENPRWSPDGYHLVFSSLRGGERNLYTVTYDGSNERQITAGGGYANPAWGPFTKH
jgi:TolB protein